MDLLCDVVFMMDIVLQFFFSYRDNNKYALATTTAAAFYLLSLNEIGTPNFALLFIS